MRAGRPSRRRCCPIGPAARRRGSCRRAPRAPRRPPRSRTARASAPGRSPSADPASSQWRCPGRDGAESPRRPCGPAHRARRSPAAARGKRQTSAATAPAVASTRMSKSSSGMGNGLPEGRLSASSYPADTEGAWKAYALDVDRSRPARQSRARTASRRPPGRTRGTLRRPAAPTASSHGLLRGAADGLRAPGRDLDLDRAARDRRAAEDGWPCAHRRERRQVPRLRPHAPPHGRLGGRLDRRRRAAASHPGRSDRAGMRVPAQVADRRLRGLRVGCRIGDLPGDLVGGAARSAPRPAARGPARGRQLSVRSHGSSHRGLRRPGPAAHFPCPQPSAADSRLGRRAADRRVRGACPDVSRDAPPARRRRGVLVGIGALLVLLFACRAAGVAHAARSSRAAALARSRHAEPIA